MILIDNNKKPDEYLNAKVLFWLPPKTPYGNMQLKYLKIITRIDYINKNIIKAFEYFEESQKSQMILSLNVHEYINENIIYMIRRTIDDLLSLVYILNHHKEKGNYPEKLKVDCIAKAKSNKNKFDESISKYFDSFLNTINEISNAHKHSFINSEISSIGKDTVIIQALALKQNSLNNSPAFYSIELNDIIKDFNLFFKSLETWLKVYSEKFK